MVAKVFVGEFNSFGRDFQIDGSINHRTMPDPEATRPNHTWTVVEQDRSENDVPGWAVVANVAKQTHHGPGGQQVREGLRHFAPGAKIWVLPVQWGDGWQDAVVVGLHRGSKRYVQIVLPMRHLSDFRVEAVYKPAVMRQLLKPLSGRQGPPRQWHSQKEALEAILAHPETRDRLRPGLVPPSNEQ